ncbi:penicillin-binding protein, 1A family [Caldalkalibacillus thermarum TA2.A1]|uniref:PBP1A family penicillin-binding protein n=1 Tax=Caldalkalibacillus thermarum (strain TA2.A1) TaxID=986075 RepID=F5L472_CALTT|nr:PBP1A family penicillin-binding protein [Caldalkalibacillus thermarum]EGL83860.1 penicillin-binding protein, 1A family [Caldalkalibacillus thermarum TA2.A1]QZT34214.1 PBP1A family penicillin-binding protein [Caldalkalibacillus thermarum TA2.A1]
MEVIHESWLIRFLKWLTKVLLFTFMMTLCLSSILLFSLLYLRSQPLPPFQMQETTVIYSADGDIIDHIHEGQNRTFIPIEELPPYLLQAFIAVEDQRFYQHFGFDLKRIAGAIVANIRNRSYVEGASTITQQLARNLYLDHSKTWERKLKEALYTIQLELHLSKTEILEHYLNQIYFGHSAYGVEAAANLYFGKSARELTLAESALLAGIPKGPRYYSPLLNYANAKSRQELILHLMEEQGYITAAEREEALAAPLTLISPEKHRQDANLAPYFRDFVRQQTLERYGITEDVFDHGGLRIYTTLDADMQRLAENLFERHLPADRPLQGALLAIDPRTGYIKAMVGGRNYGQSQFNRVLAERQPGSSIKPFLYYMALEHGFTPVTLMKSEPTTFTYDNGRATYTPRNFNDRYANDYITLEQAIARSDNIYAVKTIMHVGEENFVHTLHRFGFERTFQPLPSLALGAQNVTLLEMVKGYSAFANQGVQAEPLAITRIEDRNGNVLVEEHPRLESILEPNNTFILNRMLEHVFAEGGTAYRVASVLNRPAAGKTGSTDTDAWMIGFTPQLAAGVWVGYDQNRLINHNNDGRLAATIWAHFLEGALAGQPPVLFPVPDGVVGAYINPENGLLATEHCPVKRLLYFKKGTEPVEICTEHLPHEDTIPEAVQVDEAASFWQRLKQWWTEPNGHELPQS